MQMDQQNRFPIFFMRIPDIKSQAPRELGNTAGWLGTWGNCPLRIDLTSFIQVTWSWNSCILSVTSFVVSWISIENSSTRNSWALFNSSISWVSRSALSRSDYSSWSRACFQCDCSYPVFVWSISMRWDWICLFSSRTLLSANSTLHSCFIISYFAPESNWSPCSSRSILLRFSHAERA